MISLLSNRPENPLIGEEDEEHFHFGTGHGHKRNASVLRHTSFPPPSPQSLSPASMFLSTFTNPQQSSPQPDDEGQTISGYTLGDIIGYGGTSIIRRAWSVSGGVVAVKIIRRADLVKTGNAPQARKRLQHEASVWSTLSHEHILPLFAAVHTSHADFFVTPYCPAGSLFDILKRDDRPALLQDDAGMMFRQVVRGLRYMHEICQLVHGDIKLENILVDEMGMCRIADFGMSRRIGSEDSEGEDEQLPDILSLSNPSVHRAVSLTAPSSKKQLRHLETRHRNSVSNNQPTQPLQPGSLPYAAPELLLPQISDMLRPHPGQDIWALGVMLYTLLTGRLPFADTFEPRLQMKILNGVYAVPTDIGRGAEQILEGCLERDLSNRWNIAMVDDIAWGVGWGAEGDQVTPTNPDDEPELRHKSLTPRSRSQVPDLKLPTTIDWEQEELRPRPAFEAASRRSRSLAKRSLSRAPIPSSSSSRSASRSTSRRSGASSPSLTFLSPPDSPVSTLPTFSIHRGRRPKKASEILSRSPSPSVIPATPKDADAQVSPITDVLEHPDELHLEPSIRGKLIIRSSIHPDDKSDGKRVQATVGFDEIATWTADTQDMEHTEWDDAEMETIGSYQQQQQQHRPSSMPPSRPSLLRWAKANNNNPYVKHRPTAESFLNLGCAISSNNLPRSRSALQNVSSYFD